jgi:hypothetical protein
MCRLIIRHLSLAALLFVATGCPNENDDDNTRTCTTIYIHGLTVSVEGGASSGMCEVVVTATEGPYFEELECSARGSLCACSGAGERPGVYLVEVMSGDDVVALQEIRVQADECHVMNESVSFTLR